MPVATVSETYSVPDEAYNDEEVWRAAVKESRTMDPVAYAELLRYAATVTTWSDDPVRDLREGMRILDEARESNWSAWGRVDLASYLEEGSEREQLLDRAYQMFTAENDRAGISSVLSARGEENPFEVDAAGLTDEEQSALLNDGYTLSWGPGTHGKTREELDAESLPIPSDPTNTPALVICTGVLCFMVSAGGIIEWGEAPIDGLFLASFGGCLFSLSLMITGIYMLWDVKRSASSNPEDPVP